MLIGYLSLSANSQLGIYCIQLQLYLYRLLTHSLIPDIALLLPLFLPPVSLTLSISSVVVFAFFSAYCPLLSSVSFLISTLFSLFCPLSLRIRCSPYDFSWRGNCLCNWYPPLVIDGINYCIDVMVGFWFETSGGSWRARKGKCLKARMRNGGCNT